MVLPFGGCAALEDNANGEQPDGSLRCGKRRQTALRWRQLPIAPPELCIRATRCRTLQTGHVWAWSASKPAVHQGQSAFERDNKSHGCSDSQSSSPGIRRCAAGTLRANEPWCERSFGVPAAGNPKPHSSWPQSAPTLWQTSRWVVVAF